MSAQLIFDTAPLGALIRFSDGKPKPLSRFARKFASWEEKNGIGRLVRKETAVALGNHITSASITLHHGNFASGDVVVLMTYLTYGLSSELIFEIVERPRPGMVRVLRPIGQTMELLHLAADMAQGEAWLRVHPHRSAILDPVNVKDDSAASISLQAGP